MKKLNIALLAGGDSSEREIALKSAAQIEQAMDHSKYDITVVDVQGRNWKHTTANGEVIAIDKNDFSITINGEHKAFDYALIIIHGTPGEDGKLQGYLDIMGSRSTKFRPSALLQVAYPLLARSSLRATKRYRPTRWLSSWACPYLSNPTQAAVAVA